MVNFPPRITSECFRFLVCLDQVQSLLQLIEQLRAQILSLEAEISDLRELNGRLEAELEQLRQHRCATPDPEPPLSPKPATPAAQDLDDFVRQVSLCRRRPPPAGPPLFSVPGRPS